MLRICKTSSSLNSSSPFGDISILSFSVSWAFFCFVFPDLFISLFLSSLHPPTQFLYFLLYTISQPIFFCVFESKKSVGNLKRAARFSALHYPRALSLTCSDTLHASHCPSKLLCAKKVTRRSPGVPLNVSVHGGLAHSLAFILEFLPKQGCEGVIWRGKHLPNSEQEPNPLEKRMVQYCCMIMGWIGGVWIISVPLHMQTWTHITGVTRGCERGHNLGICIPPLHLQFMHIYNVFQSIVGTENGTSSA